MSINGAPPDIPDDELVARLMSRELPSRVIDFPHQEGAGNRSGELRLMILPALEKTQAKSEAGKLTRQELKKELTREPTADDLSTDYAREMFNDVFVASLVCRFCRSKDPIGHVGVEQRPTYGRIFQSPQWILNHLSSDELAILMLEYQTLEVEEGPREQILYDDPFILQLWIDKLKRGLWKLGPLSHLAFLDLAELGRFALQRIAEAQSLGCNILDPLFLSSLSSSESQSETSTLDTISSGEPLASSSPTPSPEVITPAEARKRAHKLREGL